MDTESIKQLATDVNNVAAISFWSGVKHIEGPLLAKIERLEKALDYAEKFIDGYGAARVKENLGRDGMDAVLKNIGRIIGRQETDICPICGDEKPIDDLHRNCGK